MSYVWKEERWAETGRPGLVDEGRQAPSEHKGCEFLSMAASP
jgi:hypothetical protein